MFALLALVCARLLQILAFPAFAWPEVAPASQNAGCLDDGSTMYVTVVDGSTVQEL